MLHLISGTLSQYLSCQAMFALKALNGVVPGFEKAKLRNFGMTIGTRDSRDVIMNIY